MAASSRSGAHIGAASALPAPHSLTVAANAPDVSLEDLRVNIWIDDWFELIGSAAQLKAEGVIPANFTWPTGRASVDWKAGGLSYWLRRQRPVGHRRPWLTVDYWAVRVTVAGRDHRWAVLRGLERRAAELRLAHYRLTPAGEAEVNTKWRRYWAAIDDQAWQRFKTGIPGMVPAKRGRKKSETRCAAPAITPGATS